jgi:DNA polymerase-3 subunit epsilon
LRTDRRLLLALAVAGVALAAWMALAGLLVWSTLAPDERQSVAAVVAPRLPLLGLAWVIAMVGLAALLRVLHQRFARAPARLLESTRLLLAQQDAPRLEAGGTGELRELGQAIAELAGQRDALRRDIDTQVALASRGVQQERNRLAALMARLTQSVVVCTIDGRVVLYNAQARLQFRALSQSPRPAAGAELIGIGRSIYAVIEPQLVAHALDQIRARLARGAASPSTQFVTATRAGQLLRVQMAPVPGDAGERGEGGDALGGFILMLENVTRSFEEESLRDQLLHGLVEGSRSALGSMRAAVEMLALPDVEPAMRERFLRVVREEIVTLSARTTEVAQRATQGLKARWTMEDMLGADLVGAACRVLQERCGRPVSADEVEQGLWLRVDSFSLLQALASLACRLVDEFDVRFLQLRLASAGERARLDLVWTGQAVSTETVMSWEQEPMRFAAQSMPLSVRDVVERHGGEMWFERERVRHQAFFRFLLPTAGAPQPQEAQPAHEERPEFFDFDLFAAAPPESVLDDRPLARLAYTVFDTETTGLAPADGDRILQIGATRIVNGRLLRQECFEQLVDPQRSVPAASTAIHGITPEMVAGQPRIGEVLAGFHAFAQDTVLVAHNAAFDLRFLQLQEEATGIVFRQPVLDTLLLSAVVHPNQPSHQLEAIAARFGIPVLGRHTALGDALVTAEVLLRLIPLLEGLGVRTLRQAREAAQRTFYARLKY